MSDTYRVQYPFRSFDENILPAAPQDGPSFMLGALDLDGSVLARGPEAAADDGAWDPFVLGEPPRDYLHDVNALMRPLPGIASLFDETSEFQPHMPSLADLVDLRMQRDEFAKILSEILYLRFDGNVGAMARDAKAAPEAMARYAEGSALPRGHAEVHAIASGLSLDPEGLAYAWIYSSLRGFEEARRHEGAVNPEFFRMRIMAQSAAFLLGDEMPQFGRPVARHVADVSFSSLVDFMMMSLRAGFDEAGVYEIFSDCASYYPAVVSQMLTDPAKALKWFGGSPGRDAAAMTMISTLQLNSGSIEDAVTLDINAGTLLDLHRNGDAEFNRGLDFKKLEFFERAMAESEAIDGGPERLKDVGFDGTVDELRRELSGGAKQHWVDDILSDPASSKAGGEFRPEAIERILQRVFAEAMEARDPLFIEDAQFQNIAEMGRMVLMLGNDIPLESRLSFYHLQHTIARLRRGGAAAQELLNRYAPSMKGIVEAERAKLDTEAPTLTASQMAEQIADRLGGEYRPNARMDLRNAVAFAYLGVLAGIEPETAIETAAAGMPAGKNIHMQALEGASATIKMGHPYRAALTVAVAARRLAEDRDWCGAMQLYCAGGDTMTRAHEMMGSFGLPVHELMIWLRSYFFDAAHKASKGRIPRSRRAVRDQFNGKISDGQRALARRPHLAGVSGADLRTGEEAWSSFADASLAQRRVVAVELRPIRSISHWEPTVFSSGSWALSAGAAAMPAWR
ncbi:MAG: hypothetical protein JXA24_06675 [Proteobacteria bacterium]|nr:hypothetical protein [Pseudomonadota bacterium]